MGLVGGLFVCWVWGVFMFVGLVFGFVLFSFGLVLGGFFPVFLFVCLFLL